ncbi:MAG: PHP domain-containing protein [Oscillospiraceae bacterium]
MSCDLHTHSTFSDGTSTPEELVSAAQELGLTAVALCDHNDVDGLPRFLAAARGGRTAAVPGTEISTVFEGTELHILGLFNLTAGKPARSGRMRGAGGAI